ncbi:EF-P 5-aminopentanol modification-associated protein YfmH [Fumia xinanensis]|uniref:Insulinase family protein n=1 Tax=Fumia xinanensis TaxID=2763659 RepID=A0A926E333_9FIRM|nr:pitrilysin family protein [Fumia xinanensis]MBC8558848.1 insulinase family protein [Fumia xinanensis]PWL45836.1 MAG: insulinase family protein [Clostridiales bacterium]
MKKTVVQSPRIHEQYIRMEHESGLTILLYPMKGFSTAYALFGTKYGSVDNCFKTGDDADFVTVPDGIAHFLEHKLFESEDGDAFTLFAKTGAEANAFTSFDKTCYLFSCADNFEESLKALVTFVQAPYFTQQTVEKEQGIIGQEIRMYEDLPSWRVMFNLLEGLYVNNAVKVDIAGTVESIAKIDADLLYRCYHTFYNLSNMVIAVAGNFDPETAENIIVDGLKESKPVSIERKGYDEPREANKKEVVQNLDVAIPLFYFGYKVEPADGAMDGLKQQIELEILLDVLAGPTSDFYNEMYREGLLNANFGTEVFGGRGFLATMLGGESKDPRAVLAAFNKMIAEKKQSGLSEEDFLSCRNALYGKALKGINDAENTATAMLSYEMMDVGLFDMMEVIADTAFSDVEKRFASDFDEVCQSLSIVYPNQK